MSLLLLGLFFFLLILPILYLTVYVPLSFRSHYARQGIPSVKFLWLVGSIPGSRAANRDDDPFRVSREHVKQLGLLYVHFFGPLPRLVIHKPALLQDVLVKKANSFIKAPLGRRILRPLLGNGMLLSEGEVWKQQRMLVTPAFHFQHLKSMSSLMLKSTISAFDEWERNQGQFTHGSVGTSAVPIRSSDNSFEIEIHQAFSALTLDIIASTAFGSSFRDNPNVASSIYAAFTVVLLDLQKRNFNLVGMLPLISELPIFGKREIDDKCKKIKQTVLDLLIARRSGKNHSLCEGKDLLDLLLEARDADDHRMSEDLLVDELMTFILAGHETTSNLLTWTAYELCENVDCLRRAVEEVDLQTSGSPVDYETIKKLQYMDAVLDESLRKHPPAPFLGREALQDVTIGSGDQEVRIRKGDAVSINVAAIHENPNFWPEPEKFKPERFMISERRHPLTFIPFAAGPRSCVGSQFAKLEAKVILATMLQRFNLSMVPYQKVVPFISVTMRPKYGLRLRLTPRAKAT